MKTEKRRLLNDLLDEQRQTRREATFLAAGRILRRRRWQRVALPTFATIALLGTFALVRQIQQPTASRPAFLTTAVTTSSSTPIPEPSAAPASTGPDRSLTDAELLALFPDTPVGLVMLENGRKRLVFPRPGDEARLVRHL